jgi:hypothetical protein
MLYAEDSPNATIQPFRVWHPSSSANWSHTTELHTTWLRKTIRFLPRSNLIAAVEVSDDRTLFFAGGCFLITYSSATSPIRGPN